MVTRFAGLLPRITQDVLVPLERPPSGQTQKSQQNLPDPTPCRFPCVDSADVANLELPQSQDLSECFRHPPWAKDLKFVSAWHPKREATADS